MTDNKCILRDVIYPYVCPLVRRLFALHNVKHLIRSFIPTHYVSSKYNVLLQCQLTQLTL